MKPWNETRDDEDLEQCPCRLMPASGCLFACWDCWTKHRAAASCCERNRIGSARSAFFSLGEALRKQTAANPPSAPYSATAQTILTLTPDGLKRVEPARALYIDADDLARMLFEADEQIMAKLASLGPEGTTKRVRDRAAQLDEGGRGSHYERLVERMVAIFSREQKP